MPTERAVSEPDDLVIVVWNFTCDSKSREMFYKNLKRFFLCM